MSTWGTGPLDNAAASAFCDALDRAGPEQGIPLAVAALTGYPDPGVPGALESAVAAATLVAAELPYGPGLGPHFGPPGWPSRGLADRRHGLAHLAAVALDRILANAQELVDAWPERPRGEQWLEHVEQLRLRIDPERPYTTVYAPKLTAIDIGTELVHDRLGVDRIRRLPGAGREGVAGLLVRQLVDAANQVDRLQAELAMKAGRLAGHLAQAQEALPRILDHRWGLDPDLALVEVNLVHAVQTLAAQRHERLGRLKELVEVYQAHSVEVQSQSVGRASAARHRSTTADPATSPTAAAVSGPTVHERRSR